MAEWKRHGRLALFGGGLAAGAWLGLCDWLACGAWFASGWLCLASVAGGALLGAGAGLAGAASGDPGLATALLLAAGILLEGTSTALKELEGPARAACLFVAAIFAALALLARRRSSAGELRSRGWSATLLAALPAGTLAAALITRDPWGRVLGSGAPLLVLGLARLYPEPRRAWLAATRATPLLLFAAVFLGSTPARRAVPDAAPGPSAPKGRASVVLLVIDTLRADAPDPAGALADLERDGVEFRQCTSAAPWTLPALGSLLTSLYPSQHGAVTSATPLPEDVTTLAELLRDQGYATAAFTGGAFAGRAHRLDQGFEVFDPSVERRFAPFRFHSPLVWRVAKSRYCPLRWLVRAVDEYLGFEGVVAATRAWAEQRVATHDQRPFFLFLHTYQVHDYYIYDPSTDDGVREQEPELSPRFAGRLSVNPGELAWASQADLDVFRKIYDARVRDVERRVPELAGIVRALADERDLVWVVTADHGEGFDATRGRFHHGGRLHDDLLRVPLIVRAPGRLSPGVIDEPVRTIDVLPTVLDLVGVPVPRDLAGESLLPALRGALPFPRSAFAEEHANGQDLLSVRRDGWKRIHGRQSDELYRIADDPGETRTPTEPPPPELEQELAEFPGRYPRRTSAEIELDRVTLDHLRALGYVQ